MQLSEKTIELLLFYGDINAARVHEVRGTYWTYDAELYVEAVRAQDLLTFKAGYHRRPRR